jgi:hypothetical protein
MRWPCYNLCSSFTILFPLRYSHVTAVPANPEENMVDLVKKFDHWAGDRGFSSRGKARLNLNAVASRPRVATLEASRATTWPIAW